MLEQGHYVSAEQCWNSRHADIRFLCFQTIARYNFLSDEPEEPFDPHRLGATVSLKTLLGLDHDDGRWFSVCFSPFLAFSDALP